MKWVNGYYFIWRDKVVILPLERVRIMRQKIKEKINVVTVGRHRWAKRLTHHWVCSVTYQPILARVMDSTDRNKAQLPRVGQGTYRYSPKSMKTYTVSTWYVPIITNTSIWCLMQPSLKGHSIISKLIGYITPSSERQKPVQAKVK